MEILHFNLQQASYYRDQWSPESDGNKSPLLRFERTTLKATPCRVQTQWMENRSCTAHDKNVSFFSVDQMIWFITYASEFYKRQLLKVVTAKITPFCLDTRAGATQLFSARQQKKVAFHIFQRGHCCWAILPIPGGGATLDQLTFFDYIMQPSAADGKQGTFASRQTVSFYLSLQPLDWMSTQPHVAHFYSKSLAAEKIFTVTGGKNF